MADEDQKYDEWSILELMGKRRLGGKLTEQVVGGATMLRIDVPETSHQGAFTQFYGGSAVYCITPVSEEVARQVAELSRARPVERWELPHDSPALTPAQVAEAHYQTYDDDDEDYQP